MSKLLKIGRLSQLIIVLGVLVIVTVTLTTVQGQQEGRQKSIAKDILAAQAVLNKPAPQPITDLQSKVKNAQAELAASQAIFPKADETLSTTDTILAIAKKSGLEVTSANSNITNKKLNDIEYAVITENLSLKGQVSSILGFLATIGKSVPTSEIVSVTLVKAESAREMDSGSVTINVYTIR